MKKVCFCDLCEASYEVKHNMDEQYYPVIYCPFCGEQNEEPDDYYDEEDEE